MYLDTNIFVFARVDLSNKGKKARQIIAKIADGELSASTSTLAIDELIWVLKRELKSYNKSIEYCEHLMSLPIRFLPVNFTDVVKALNFMKSGIKLRDAIHLGVALNNGIKEILSDDPDFGKIKEINWIRL